MSNFFTKAIKGFNQTETVNPSDSRLNGSLFYQIGTFFGYNVGAKNLGAYLQAFGKNSLVYMIIHRISTNTAGIERKYEDENGEPIEDSEIQKILESPNQYQGIQEFYETCYEYFLASGNCFIRFIEGVGMGFEMEVLNSSRMKLQLSPNGLPLRWIYTDNMGNDIPYELEDVLHVKTSNIVEVTNSGIYFGLSPLEAAWDIVKSSAEIFNAEASIFKNRGIIGILTNETDVPMLTKDRKELQEQFDSEVGGSDRFNKIKISNTKLKYIQTGMSPTDLKLLEGIMNKLRLLCSVYGMSSVLFNDNENSTYNNVLEAEKASYNNVFIPLANKFDREISKFLNDRLKLSREEFVTVDKTSIDVIKASTNEIAQAINNLTPQAQQRIISAMTRNEARDIIGLAELIDTVLGNELVGDGKTEPEIQPAQTQS